MNFSYIRFLGIISNVFKTWFNFIKVFFDWQGFIFITIIYMFNIIFVPKIACSYWFVTISFQLETFSNVSIFSLFDCCNYFFFWLFPCFLSTTIDISSRFWFTIINCYVCFSSNLFISSIDAIIGLKYSSSISLLFFISLSFNSLKSFSHSKQQFFAFRILFLCVLVKCSFL